MTDTPTSRTPIAAPGREAPASGPGRTRRRWSAAWAGLAFLAGCRSEMYDQPKYGPLEASSFFDDGQSSRPLVPGTVARGQLREDDAFYAGKVNGEHVTKLPLPIDRALLERGRERYNIFCAPCHDRTGSGKGMIVQRGFSAPPSFHTDKMREEPVGHYYEAITNGHGAMYSYAARVKPRDRWAITAYIRALQLSQNARVQDLTAEDRSRLEKAPAGGAAP